MASTHSTAPAEPAPSPVAARSPTWNAATRPSRRACWRAWCIASAEKSTPTSRAPVRPATSRPYPPRPQARSTSVAPGDRRSASVTSAIPCQVSKLLDSRPGGRPRWRWWISSLTDDAAISAYQPSKYCARAGRMLSTPPVSRQATVVHGLLGRVQCGLTFTVGGGRLVHVASRMARMAALRRLVSIRSMNSTPSRWSVSCCRHRARLARPTTWTGSPVTVKPVATVCIRRLVSKYRPGMDRHPSGPSCSSSSGKPSTGLIRCPDASSSWKTKTRSPTPTWGAARPEPRWSYSVSSRLRTRRRSAASKSVTSSAGVARTGSPNSRIGRTDMLHSCLKAGFANTIVCKVNGVRVKPADPGLERHPVREALLELIRRDGVVTATDAARELGESTGLYSFHLRRLARYGLIEEAPARRGRVRPWRLADRGAAGPPHSVQAGPGGPAALGGMARGLEDESYQRWLEQRQAAPEQWRRDEVLSQVLYLTPEEMTGVADVIRAVIGQYRHREDAPSARPAGAAPVAVVARLFPLLAPDAGPAAASPQDR